ncbi:Hypothetical predicted protein, partial [Mytilus galloprovincialis]
KKDSKTRLKEIGDTIKQLQTKKDSKTRLKEIGDTIKQLQNKQKGSKMQDKNVQQQKPVNYASDMIQQQQKLEENSVKKLLNNCVQSKAMIITENIFDELEDLHALGETDRLDIALHERQSKTYTELYSNGQTKAMYLNKLDTEQLDIHIIVKSPDVAKLTVNQAFRGICRHETIPLEKTWNEAYYFNLNKQRLDSNRKTVVKFLTLLDESCIKDLLYPGYPSITKLLSSVTNVVQSEYFDDTKISLDKITMAIKEVFCSMDDKAIHKDTIMRCIIDHEINTNCLNFSEMDMSEMYMTFIYDKKRHLQNADSLCEATSAMMNIKECLYTKASYLVNSEGHCLQSKLCMKDFKGSLENGVAHNYQSSVDSIVVNEDSNIMKEAIEGDNHNQMIESLAENKDNKNDERSKKNSNDVHGVIRVKLPATSKTHLKQPYPKLYDADSLNQIESEKDCPYILYPAAHPLLLEKIRRIAPSSEMNPFTQRIHSFVLGDNPNQVSWPDSAIVRPLQLACAGFSYVGKGQEIICNYCGFRTNTDCWHEIDENYAMFIHRNAGTTCSFMNTFANSETVITDNIEDNVIEESEVYCFYYLVCQFDNFYTDIKILKTLFNRKDIIIVELFKRQSWNELIVKQRQIYNNLVSTFKKHYRKNI